MKTFKTNTAVRKSFGPFLDPTDGKTAETALDVTGLVCEIYQDKDDGNAVVRTAFSPTASGGSNDMVHIADDVGGYYDLEITATQLNWLGTGKISFYDVDGFLICWEDIEVVSAQYFDAKFGTGNFSADVKAVSSGVDFSATMKASITAAVPSASAIQTEMEENGASILDSLQDRLTATRAGYLDELDFGLQEAINGLDGKIDTVDGIVDDILEDTGTGGVVVADASKTGYALSAEAIDAIWDEVMDSNAPANADTIRKIINIVVSALAAKSSGGGTENPIFRDTGNTKNRISATVDEDGNRTAVTLDGT